jgi:hypothetical protein
MQNAPRKLHLLDAVDDIGTTVRDNAALATCQLAAGDGEHPSMMKQNVGRKFLPIGMRAVAVVCLIFSALILLADMAHAQSSGRGGANVRAIRGGYCPLGTCNIHGGRMANNLANCKASNCR